MIESDTGIILRTRQLTETSLIVHWLTRKSGRMATVARGARRPKSPFSGKLDIFYQADFSFSRSRKSDLHILREVRLDRTHAAIRIDLLKLHQGAYAIRFIEQATETETPLPRVFELLSEFLDSLCTEKSSVQNVFALELKLLRELGLEPDFEKVELTNGTKQIVRVLTRNALATTSHLKMTVAQISELSHFLHVFLIFHLGKLPNGRANAISGKIQ
jgi:DNA repair protein RecO (recombination protein O)